MLTRSLSIGRSLTWQRNSSLSEFNYGYCIFISKVEKFIQWKPLIVNNCAVLYILHTHLPSLPSWKQQQPRNNFFKKNWNWSKQKMNNGFKKMIWKNMCTISDADAQSLAHKERNACTQDILPGVWMFLVLHIYPSFESQDQYLHHLLQPHPLGSFPKSDKCRKQN